MSCFLQTWLLPHQQFMAFRLDPNISTWMKEDIVLPTIVIAPKYISTNWNSSLYTTEIKTPSFSLSIWYLRMLNSSTCPPPREATDGMLDKGTRVCASLFIHTHNLVAFMLIYSQSKQYLLLSQQTTQLQQTKLGRLWSRFLLKVVERELRCGHGSSSSEQLQQEDSRGLLTHTNHCMKVLHCVEDLAS